jgi:ABC-type phosphate/phosphonate transport system substrate-binding protein
MSWTWRVRGALALAAGAVLTAAPAPAKPGAEGNGPVQIGLVRTMFRDIPEPMFGIIAKPFNRLMAEQTGMAGEVTLAADAEVLARQIDQGHTHLGVFQGFEFAWARLKHPNLQPLVVAVGKQRKPTALIVVRSDSTIDGLAALKGKTVAVAKGTKEYCRLYLERRGPQGDGCTPKLTEPASIEDALDDVVDGSADAAVVDGASLDCFKTLKPGRAAKLKVSATSGPFPAAVIAYRRGELDPTILQRFEHGLITANRTRQGVNLLGLWRLQGFEAPPADYEQHLTETLKAYPPPAETPCPK